MTFSNIDIVLSIFYGLVFLLGTLGNAFVIKWFGVKEERKKAGNKLVVVLAVNDFLSSIFVPLLQFHNIVSKALDPPGVWYIGKDLCISLAGLQQAFLIATSFLLMTIAIERFR